MKAQNMHQLRVLGLNNKPSTSCHCLLLLANGSYALALGPETKTGHHALVHQTHEGKIQFLTQSVISYTLLSRNH